MLDTIRCYKALYVTQVHRPSFGTTTRDKTPLKGLGLKKGEYRGVAMMLKTGMKMAQYYAVFKYGPLRSQNNIKSQDRMMMAETGTDLAP